MHQEKPLGSAVNDPCHHGRLHQRREIEHWENAGWIFLRWIESPLLVAVLENSIGDVVFIDDHGFAWMGANFSKANPVPLDQDLPWGFGEWVVT